LRQIQQVNDGNVRMTDTFSSLGVELRDTNGELRNQEAVFSDVLVKLSAMENVTERNALAQVLLGRSASELAPLLNEGAEAVDNYINANESAVMVSQELADESARYNDAMQTFNETMQQAKNQALLPLVSAFADFAVQLSETEVDTEIFNETLKQTAEISSVILTGIYDLLVGFDLLQKKSKGMDEIVSDMNRSFDDVSTDEITSELGRFTEELEIAQSRVEEIMSDSSRSGQRAWQAEGEQLQQTIAVRQSLINVYKAEIQRRNEIVFTQRTMTEAVEENTEAVILNEDALYSRFQEEQSGALDNLRMYRVMADERQRDIEALITASEARSEAMALEREEQMQLALEQQQFINFAVEGAMQIGSFFQSVHKAKMSQISKEYDAQEDAIKNSTMSEKKKEKALSKLAEERAKKEVEPQERQLAYTKVIGLANTALVVQNQIKAITSAGAEAPFGTKIASMIAMGVATAGYVAQVKSAQASIPNREHGGAVRRGSLYEVAENGKDELFESGGKTFLLPSQGGRVKSNNQISNSSNVTINANFNGGDMATIEQRLPELVAKGMEMADREGRIDYGGMPNFNRAVGA